MSLLGDRFHRGFCSDAAIDLSVLRLLELLFHCDDHFGDDRREYARDEDTVEAPRLLGRESAVFLVVPYFSECLSVWSLEDAEPRKPHSCRAWTA